MREPLPLFLVVWALSMEGYHGLTVTCRAPVLRPAAEILSRPRNSATSCSLSHSYRSPKQGWKQAQSRVKTSLRSSSNDVFSRARITKSRKPAVGHKPIDFKEHGSRTGGVNRRFVDVVREDSKHSKCNNQHDHHHYNQQILHPNHNGHIISSNGIESVKKSSVATSSRAMSITTSSPTAEGNHKELDQQVLVSAAMVIFLATSVGIGASLGLTPTDLTHALESLFTHPQEFLQDVVEHVKAMGPAGLVYFGIFYLVAEVLAVPATPLTLSAGYLFGVSEGVAVVLLAATIAASIGFFVGKTYLRSFVERMLHENPKYEKLDRAIGQEGFKLLVLVRLSPVFPFSLSNYLYGASSIDFPSFFWATLLGFTPGTIAYVYAGMIGNALTLGESEQPWYFYAAGLGALLAVLKLVTDVANNIIEAIEE